MLPNNASIAPGALLLALACCGGAALAQPSLDEDFDDKEKSWHEIAIRLPAAPKPENLLPFYVSPTATLAFAVDAQSLSLGADGVIRYTLVATSDAGARNVNYEGIRCETYERKLYAFGQPDGSWSRARRDQWERISANASNRHHATLAKDYFCLEQTVAGTAEEMIKRIRQKRTLAPH